MTKLNELTLAEAAKGLRAKEFTVRELWDACVAVAREKNPELNAYLEIFDADDAAIAWAQEQIDRGGVFGEEGGAHLLCGIPLAVKDNILIEGKTASAASRMLENYRATYSATVIEALREYGALFVGRTNMDEFALGGSTENSAFGVTKNPHDLSRVAGGTSGGSAAAVAAHLCIAALGSDTGGSVRNPASFCGVVGLKPTYGAVSRYGLIAAASSLDVIGPLAKTVEDAHILFEAIHGRDTKDSTTILPALTKKEVRRIGVLADLPAMIMPEVMAAFNAQIKALKEEGCEIVPISIPESLLNAAVAAYYIVNFAEVSTNLSRLDGIRYGRAARGETLLEDYVKSRTEGFGEETHRRILLGTFVLSAGYIDAYYKKAEVARAELRAEYRKAFEKVDVIATPTMANPAFRIGEKGDPLSMYLEDIFTVTANLTGMPAISVPMGTVERDGKHLPVGMHFTAPHQGESMLSEIAGVIERYNQN